MPRNHLTPTQVVDKNGKPTTVYRRTETLKSTGAPLPAPSAAPQPSDGMTTPLTLPEALTAQERRALGKQFDSLDVQWGVPSSHILEHLDVRSRSLLKRIVDRFPGDVPLVKKRIVPAITNECLPEECTNILLVLEKLLAGNHADALERWDYGIMDTVLGLCHSDDRSPADQVIKTEEELAGKSALNAFILTHGRKHDPESLTKTLVLRRGAFILAEYMALRNRHLERLIMERPEDLDAISRYVEERGMHKSNKGPVEAMRAYLDDETIVAPVSSGWL